MMNRIKGLEEDLANQFYCYRRRKGESMDLINSLTNFIAIEGGGVGTLGLLDASKPAGGFDL